MTFRKGVSDKRDESESGLHSEGGDDRHKVIMILLRSHRPGVEAGLVPREPSFLSVKGLDLLLHSIAKIKRQINPGLKIDGVLMTMVDSRTVNASLIRR